MTTVSTTILALDASTSTTVLVVGRLGPPGDHVILASSERTEFPNQTSDRLTGDIERLLGDAGLSFDDVDVLACGRGPGTFTGTRVALATAKGLALGLDCPVTPVSTLHAMTGDLPESGLILCLLPATQGEVFGCVFGSAEEPDEWCRPLAGLSETMDGDAPDRVIAPACVIQQPAFPADWRPQARPTAGPTASGLWTATRAAMIAPGPQDAGIVHATYLRKSYAEMGINRPKRKVGRNPIRPRE